MLDDSSQFKCAGGQGLGPGILHVKNQANINGIIIFNNKTDANTRYGNPCFTVTHKACLPRFLPLLETKTIKNKQYDQCKAYTKLEIQ